MNARDIRDYMLCVAWLALALLLVWLNAPPLFKVLSIAFAYYLAHAHASQRLLASCYLDDAPTDPHAIVEPDREKAECQPPLAPSRQPVGEGTRCVVDVGAVQTHAELYATLSEAMGRPLPAGPYSLAWDTDDLPMPFTITLIGFEALSLRLPSDAQLLRIVLKDMAEHRGKEGFVVRFS